MSDMQNVLQKFFDVLEKTSLPFFLIGGIPRDYIFFLKSKSITPKQISPSQYNVDISHFWEFIHECNHPIDIDIATTLQPKESAKILDEILAIVSPYVHRKRQFATNTIELPNAKIEITSTRIDKNCDGRHAKMKFGISFFQDSIRRDFTFNAFYMNLSGDIFDFHNGIKHLLQKEIHFIGDAQTRIIEDFTRIKRYYNFAQRFDMKNVKIEETINHITQSSTTPIIMR